MKRASYKHGVEIIALNDEAGEMDAEVMQSMISVSLLADLFGVEASKVAHDVVAFRKKHASDA